ncbi:uncharacterized protein BDV17DRAFT_270424 [Aspergillus undulatus]|uniref:uncharacterized protein n=1 Tax=Aspergillus undulatus TaxID=1810928 RepID=UPI003CCDDEE6
MDGYRFAHDIHLDWILKHGKKLRKLSLNRPDIVSELKIGRAERHCISITLEFLPINAPGDFCKYKYNKHWSDIFAALQQGLPYLRIFVSLFSEPENDATIGHFLV